MQLKYLSFIVIKFFIFPVEAFQYSNIHEKEGNMTNATVKEVWPWHQKFLKILKITGKILLKVLQAYFVCG